MKECSKCHITKSLTSFRKQAKGKNGVRNPCKACISEIDRNYRKSDTCKLSQKKYRESPKGRAVYAKGKERYRNSEKGKATEREYYLKTDRSAYLREYNKDRLRFDIAYKLKKRIRIRLLGAIKGNYKRGSAVKDLGCSIPELKNYLESKFKKGMSWENHGLHGWHIDHIKPLSSFDFSKRSQYIEACNYKNLQPLWAKENLQKSNK